MNSLISRSIQPLSKRGSSLLHLRNRSPSAGPIEPLSLGSCRMYNRNRVNDALSDMLVEVDRTSRDMQRLMDRVFGGRRSSFWDGPWGGVTTRGTWGTPITVPELEYQELKPCIEVNPDGTRHYKQYISVEGYDPKDITVQIQDRILRITAKKEVVKGDHHKSYSEQSYSFSLPPEVNPESVRTFVSDGYLRIEAPLPALELPKQQPEGHELKIDRQNSTQSISESSKK